MILLITPNTDMLPSNFYFVEKMNNYLDLKTNTILIFYTNKMADVNDYILKNILRYQEPYDIIMNANILGLKDIAKDTLFWESCFLTRYGFSPKISTLVKWNDMHHRYADWISDIKDRLDKYGIGERCFGFVETVRGDILKKFIKDPDNQAELDHIINYILDTYETHFPNDPESPPIYHPYIEIAGYRPWSLIIGLLNCDYGTDVIPHYEMIIDEDQLKLFYMRVEILGLTWHG